MYLNTQKAKNFFRKLLQIPIFQLNVTWLIPNLLLKRVRRLGARMQETWIAEDKSLCLDSHPWLRLYNLIPQQEKNFDFQLLIKCPNKHLPATQMIYTIFWALSVRQELQVFLQLSFVSFVFAHFVHAAMVGDVCAYASRNIGWN